MPGSTCCAGITTRARAGPLHAGQVQNRGRSVPVNGQKKKVWRWMPPPELEEQYRALAKELREQQQHQQEDAHGEQRQQVA